MRLDPAEAASLLRRCDPPPPGAAPQATPSGYPTGTTRGRIHAVPTTKTPDGSSITYDIRGDGPALLLISGLGFGRWSWFKQVPALSRRFRTITFDSRSPRNPEHGVAELA